MIIVSERERERERERKGGREGGREGGRYCPPHPQLVVFRKVTGDISSAEDGG